MGYLLDLIVFILIVLITFMGYKKGLIKVAFKLISFVLAIIISIILYKPISTFIINNTPLYEKIENTVEERLSSSETTQKEADNLLSNYYYAGRQLAVAKISENVAITIVNISVIFIVFISSRLVLGLFKFSGDLIAKLPLIKQINHLGGFIYGVIKSFIIVYAFFAIISLLAPLIDLNNFIELINSSIISNIIFNNNFIFMIFS